MYSDARYLLSGDSAVTVEFGDEIDPGTNERVSGMFYLVERTKIPGVTECIPTYRSLTVLYDPERIPFGKLAERLKVLEDDLKSEELPKGKVVEVPILYGGSSGPDLEFVARHNSISPEEVVRIHSGTDYRVYMLGFTPGFPYLGGMKKEISAPRLESPRLRIAAGSVGIAGGQTGIYPVESPGGWRIIGRTPIRLFDPERMPPVIVEAGDFIRFVPVDFEEYTRISERIGEGSFEVNGFSADGDG